MSKVFIAHKSDITEGQAKGFDPLNQGRDSLFIVHKNGEYYGYKDICPHYGDTTLPWKKINT
ncbi:Rieske (2Fe-2S) protein [Pseudoalteromonas sp. H100]|nr:Rieske 2Fe-2S domain-containing protein [Pseudoalteromonas sp. H100]WFO20650.1 Rieske (2Fe-2S) protein [Pseudoalteromonas sp. H100]